MTKKGWQKQKKVLQQQSKCYLQIELWTWTNAHSIDYKIGRIDQKAQIVS